MRNLTFQIPGYDLTNHKQDKIHFDMSSDHQNKSKYPDDTAQDIVQKEHLAGQRPEWQVEV